MSYNVADMECDLCLKRNQFFIHRGEECQRAYWIWSARRVITPANREKGEVFICREINKSKFNVGFYINR